MKSTVLIALNKQLENEFYKPTSFMKVSENKPPKDKSKKSHAFFTNEII